ncbi:MAG: hypothetical protein CMJ82_04725 [Planctomycetaceae bacterium]|nr:hypothetical protein [Planctomycetaceae bacterium]|tara:strand:- start:795 stop:1166 length:372 start_codon:yes stop_codon:yes gene_type:complete
MTKLQRSWVICIGCIGLMIAGFIGSQQSATHAQNPIGTRLGKQTTGGSVHGNNYLLMSSQDTEEGQQLTVIDVKTKAICVYLIQRGSGKIKLLSARNARWDFELDEFNSDTPTPREIQRLIQQ